MKRDRRFTLPKLLERKRVLEVYGLRAAVRPFLTTPRFSTPTHERDHSDAVILRAHSCGLICGCHSFVSLVGLFGAILFLTTHECAGQPPPTPTFVFASVQYTDANNKVQTVQFTKGSVQIPAVAVKNTIVINGTYTPNTNPPPLFTGTVIAGGTPTVAGAPVLASGNWTVNVLANSYDKNTPYTVGANTGGFPGTPDAVIINNITVNVAQVTINVANY